MAAPVDHNKPEPVLPQVFEFGGDQNRSTEYSDSQHLHTLSGTRTPSVEDLEIDEACLEPRRDQVWYGPSPLGTRTLFIYFFTHACALAGERWASDRLM